MPLRKTPQEACPGTPGETGRARVIERGLLRGRRGILRVRHQRQTCILRAMAQERSPLVVLMSVAVAAVVIFVGVLGWTDYRRKQEKAAAQAAAGQYRIAVVDAAPEAQREAGERTGRSQAAVDHALKQVSSEYPASQCDGALALGRMRVREETPRLESMMNNAEAASVRICAATALIDLGEIQGVMSAYQRWLRDDDTESQRAALTGFGRIGPAAADTAMPYFNEALRSDRVADRYLAVDGAAKMGPAGRSLLESALNDSDARIRNAASMALGRGRGR